MVMAVDYAQEIQQCSSDNLNRDGTERKACKNVKIVEVCVNPLDESALAKKGNLMG